MPATLVHALPLADRIIVLRNSGTIEQGGTFAELRAMDGYVKKLVLDAASLTTKDVAEETLVSPERRPETKTRSAAADPRKRKGDITSHLFYFKSIPASHSLAFIALCIINTIIGCLPQIWLRIWTEHGTGGDDRASYFGVYMAFTLGQVLVIGIAVWWFMVVCIPRSATHFHWLLAKTTFGAPLTWFSATDTGDLLNRFSQDMTLVDQQMPMAFFEMTISSLGTVATTALIASGAQYVGAVIPLCAACLYLLQMYYLRMSRQLRLLDLEAKTPLYTHFTETMAGVVTIRAFGWKQAFVAENLKALDFSQLPYYMLYCIQRWLGVVLDLFVAGVAVLLVS